MMKAGTITKIILTRGFGFICDDATGEDYFMHVEALSDEVKWESLHKGVRVKFIGKNTKNGLRAEGVTLE